MSLEPIRRFLPSAIQSAGIAAQVTAARVLSVGESVLLQWWGVEKAAYVTFTSFHEGVLKIRTSSGAALQELKMERVRLQNDINRVLGAKIVVQIDLGGV